MDPEEIQRIQSDYRRRIADAWSIEPGAKLLEVGCGQGDMTAILAEKVGATGKVTAVDIANREYGAPLTIGEATDRLKASSLGDRIDFRFEFDLLDPNVHFDPDAFDGVVLVHSLWYFRSSFEILASMRRLRQWSKRLFLVEWDLVPRVPEQLSHFAAVIAQAAVEVFKTESQANVRTAISRSSVKDLLQEAGWTVIQEQMISTEGLQDADWEISICLANSMREARELNLPPQTIKQVKTQIDFLEQAAKPSGNRPLDSYTLTAE